MAGLSGILGGAGELAGGVVGDWLGSGDRERQRKAIEDAINGLQGVNAEAGPSAFGGVQHDPRLEMAQRSVLDRLMKEGTTQGLGLQDRAALTEAQNQVAARERGSREAILQDMSRRGMSGSGSELAAALTNQQGAADRASAAGTSAAADARRRQLQALSESGQFATTMRGQDFGEQATKAGAQDALSRFNASARLNKGTAIAGIKAGPEANYYGSAADRWTKRGAGLGSAAGQGLGYAIGGA